MKSRLCIISASFNAGSCIDKLIQSLEAQTDKEFTWVLVDGGSSDDTLEKAQKIKGVNKEVILNENDFGIYHAINAGIRLCSNDYYIVAGCDDSLHPNAIENFKKAISESNADIVVANVNTPQKLMKPKGSELIWLYGGRSLIASHSVGTSIRCSLHRKLGVYSSLYPIYADSEFIVRAFINGAQFSYFDFVAGDFSLEGVSNNNQLTCFSEQFRALVANGYNFYLQWLLFNLRLIKWSGTIHHLQATVKKTRICKSNR